MIHRIKKYAAPLAEMGTFPLRSSHLYLHSAAVQVTEKVRFGSNARQYLLYFHPAEGVPLRSKWVIFFHGGGWHLGRPAMFPHIIDFFAGRGYALILPAYRLCPRYAFPDMLEDVQATLEATMALMRRDAGSEQSLIVGGMSAGATLAAHLSFDAALWQRAHCDQKLVHGFLSCGGPLDLEQMPDTFVVRRFAGGRAGSDAFRAANPFSLIKHQPDFTPTAFFIHGTNDRIVPYSSARSFYEQYAQYAPAHWLGLKGGQHIDAIRWIDDDVTTGQRLEKWIEES